MYDSGYEYLRDELEFSEENIAPEYRDVEMKHMYRVHSDEPRDVLLLQKNPNLKQSWISESIHGPHEHLSNWEGDWLARNIAHSRTTISTYLEDAGDLKLKYYLQALSDVHSNIDFGFTSTLDQEEWTDYLSVEIGSEYSSSRESQVIDSDSGFFGDFAYSNAMKFQGPRDQVSVKDDDREWLQDELAAIDPELILSLGTEAIHSLKDLGFERTGYDGPFNGQEGKIYRYSGPDARLEGIRVLRLYHLQASKSTPHRTLHKSLRALRNE